MKEPKIVLEINGVDTPMTVAEAKKLKTDLESIFGSKEVPYYPWIEPYLAYPNVPDYYEKVTCDGTGPPIPGLAFTITGR